MTSPVLAEILATLGMVVFERLPDGVFLRSGPTPAPAWFSRLFLDAAQGESVTIAQAFPLLEPFLDEAEDVWRPGGTKHLRSDPFLMTDTSGAELVLVASAVAVEHRRFLIIERPYDFEERRRTLQSAREHLLAHEQHLRRTGALLTPVNAAQHLANRLATSGLSPEQKELAAGISEHLATLAASIEMLAPLPKGVSRRIRR